MPASDSMSGNREQNRSQQTAAANRPQSAASRALVALEDRAQRYETALMQVLDAVDLADAKIYARRAISEAHFGPVDERGGSA